MNQVIIAVATGLYAGNLSAGSRRIAVSALALLLWLPLKNLPLPAYLAMLLSFYVLGFLIAGTAEKLLDRTDAQPIAIDEIGGLLVSLSMVPHHPLAWTLCLVAFHLFHRLKPWPTTWIGQHLHGGIGVMSDDLVAGIYAAVSLQLLYRLAALIA